jgi:hypothetical protein
MRGQGMRGGHLGDCPACVGVLGVYLARVRGSTFLCTRPLYGYIE